MGRLAVLGVGAIIAFIAACVVAISLATRDDRPAGRAGAGETTRAQAPNGVMLHRALAPGQPSSPGEQGSLPPLAPQPMRMDGVERKPPEEMKAVDWRSEKPPRSAEDLN